MVLENASVLLYSNSQSQLLAMTTILDFVWQCLSIFLNAAIATVTKLMGFGCEIHLFVTSIFGSEFISYVGTAATVFGVVVLTYALAAAFKIFTMKMSQSVKFWVLEKVLGWFLQCKTVKQLLRANIFDTKVCLDILEQLQLHEFGWVFNKPVDTDIYTDYESFIPHPIDFSIIQRKLECFEYNDITFFEMKKYFKSDVYQVFENAKTYNQKSSWVYKFAEDLEVEFNFLLGLSDAGAPKRSGNSKRSKRGTAFKNARAFMNCAKMREDCKNEICDKTASLLSKTTSDTSFAECWAKMKDSVHTVPLNNGRE